jgi:hypothetical protein
MTFLFCNICTPNTRSSSHMDTESLNPRKAQLTKHRSQHEKRTIFPYSPSRRCRLLVAIYVVPLIRLAQLHRHMNPPLNCTTCTLNISIYIKLTLIFENELHAKRCLVHAIVSNSFYKRSLLFITLEAPVGSIATLRCSGIGNGCCKPGVCGNGDGIKKEDCELHCDLLG